MTLVPLAPYRQPIMNHALSNVSVRQLKRAIKIKTKLETLQAQLDGIMGGGEGIPSPFRKRKMSAAGRAAIAARSEKAMGQTERRHRWQASEERPQKNECGGTGEVVGVRKGAMGKGEGSGADNLVVRPGNSSQRISPPAQAKQNCSCRQQSQ